MADFEKGAVDLGSLFYSQNVLTPSGPTAKFGHTVNYGGMLSRFNHHSQPNTFAVKLEALAGLGQPTPASKPNPLKLG